MSKRQTPRTVEAPCSACGRETTWQVVRENRSEDKLRCTGCRATGYRARSFWHMSTDAAASRLEQAQAEYDAAKAAQAQARTAHNEAFAAYLPVRERYEASQQHVRAAYQRLQEAKEGSPLHRQEIAGVLRRAGFTQGAVDRSRISHHAEGFTCQQASERAVSLRYIWCHSVFEAERQAAYARRDEALPRMVQALRAAGYWVSEPTSMGGYIVRRQAPPSMLEKAQAPGLRNPPAKGLPSKTT
jgi:hypothetical protein